MDKLKEIAQKVMREDRFILDMLTQKKNKNILRVLDYAVKEHTGETLSKRELIKVLEEMVFLNSKHETLEEFISKLTDKDSVVAIAKVGNKVERGLLEEANAIYCIKEGATGREKTIRLIDIDEDMVRKFDSIWLVKREKRENVEDLAKFLIRAVDWRKDAFVIAIPHLGVKIGDYGYPEVIVRDFGVSISIPPLNETKKSLGLSYSTEYLKGVITFGEKIGSETIIPNNTSEIYIHGNKIVVKTGLIKAMAGYNIHVCEEALKSYPLDPKMFTQKSIPNMVEAMRGISL